MSGICFVGFVADSYRGGFVLLPIGIAVVIGLSFLLRGKFITSILVSLISCRNALDLQTVECMHLSVWPLT